MKNIKIKKMQRYAQKDQRKSDKTETYSLPESSKLQRMILIDKAIVEYQHRTFMIAEKPTIYKSMQETKI